MLVQTGRARLAEAARQLLSAYDGPAETWSSLAFRPLERRAFDGRMGAVDGGSCVVLDLVSSGCLAVRATSVIRQPDDAYVDGPVWDRTQVVSRDRAEPWWSRLLAEFAGGAELELPPPRTRQTMALWADAARGVLEDHAARSVLGDLGRGDLLLLDGSLEEDPGGPASVGRLMARAEARGVTLVAVSKDSARSLRGPLPFLVELEEAAAAAKAPERFLVDVSEPLGLGGRGFRTYGVRWDPRSPVLRVDVPEPAAGDVADVLGRVAAACNDPTVPGYPYPLARVHGRVRFSPQDVQDIRRGLEAIVCEARGTRLGLRLFGRGRDLLELTG